jgi:hypothetical protein
LPDPEIDQSKGEDPAERMTERFRSCGNKRTEALY